MTPVFAARRRAEEFAALVEDASTHRAVDARYADLLDVVAEMRRAPAPEARPEFVADLRERLLAEAASVLAPTGSAARTDTDRLALPARRPARERKIAAAVGGLALVGATTSMAMAAQSALPGDTLYPVKRAIESVHTGLSVGEGDKGSTMLANASGRLDEATQLSKGGDAQDGIVIADTLNDFTDQAAQASDLLLADYSDTGNQQSVTELRDFTAQSLDRLTALESTVPVEARDELIHAAQVLIAIDAAAQQACPSCGGTGISQVPPTFTPSSATSGVPFSSATEAAHHSGGHHHKHQASKGDGTPNLPSVDAGDLPPGSILGSTSGTDSQSGDGTKDPADDPIGALTQGLTGGGEPTSNPTSSDLGDTVNGVTDGVGGLLDGAGDTVTKDVPLP